MTRLPPLPHRRAAHQCGISQRGISLIEGLVALLLLSFGVIGMAALHARSIQYALDAEDRNRAALLANELASLMWLAQTPSLPTATVTAWQTRVATPTASGLPNGSGSVSTDAAGIATITITWRPPSLPSSGGTQQYITKVLLP